MSIDTARVGAILFDVDGTLRDTDDQYVARVAALLRPMRWLLPERDQVKAARWLVMRFEGPVNRLIGLADKLGLDGALHKFFDWASPRRSERHQAHFALVPGAQKTVEILAQHFPLGVVTTRGADSTRAFLAATELAQHFPVVIDGLSTQYGKPAPDPVIRAAQQLGVAVENCLMVGDTVVDVLAAKAAGAQAVGLLSGFGEEEELVAQGADLLLPSVAELPDALLKT